MDSKHDHPQPTEPVWNERHGDAEVIRLLKQRISELEGESRPTTSFWPNCRTSLNDVSNSGLSR